MKGCFSVCLSSFPRWLCVGADGSPPRAWAEGGCSKQDLIFRQEEVHRHVVGTTLPERPRCGHASLWCKPRLYQELEGPTVSSLWGQAAMGLRCGMRTTKCQLLVTSLCVMVSRQVWGDLCRTEVLASLPFLSPLREGRVSPHSVFCGQRASKANCLSYHCTLGGYRWLPASPPLC